MDYGKLEDVLRQFRQIPIHKQRSPTFMEITSYPHLENVASNVLEFYFNSNAEHNLGTLLLDSLLDCVQSNIEIKGSQRVNVSREITTSSGKRIDLLIEAPPSAVIAIENKIFHIANNDFLDYESYVNKIANSSNTLCIVLSLYPVKKDTLLSSFQEVLYKDFFESILSKIGKRIIHADNRYLTFLLDFIETVDNLQGIKKMNREILSFLEKNQKDVILLLRKTEEIQSDMRKKVKDLKTLMEAEKPDLSIWNHSTKDHQFRETVGYEIPMTDDFCIWIAADLTLSGWRIRLKDNESFNAERKGENEENYETRFGKWLREKGILVSPHTQYRGNFTYGDSFPYDADPSIVNTEIQLLIEGIYS